MAHFYNDSTENLVGDRVYMRKQAEDEPLCKTSATDLYQGNLRWSQMGISLMLGTVAGWVLLGTAWLCLFARGEQPPWSPALSIITHQQESTDVYEKSPYAHPRTDAVDRAWSELMEPINLRISDEEMVSSNTDRRSAVELADKEGGYVGGLVVYHNLHCLNFLRLFLTQDFVAGSGSATPNLTFDVPHLEHCVESLRKSIMCQGETALWTGKWVRSETGQMDYDADFAHGRATCINWGELEQWARPRALLGKRYLRAPQQGDLQVDIHET